MTRLMRAHALAWSAPPTGLAVYGWLSGEFWLVVLVVISLPGICISASRSTRWLEKHQARCQARRVWRGPSGTLWTLVALLVLLLPMHAFAQVGDPSVLGADVLGGATSLSTLPAATPGPVDPAAFALFQTLFNAITDGLPKVVEQDVAVMVGVVHETIVPLTTLAIIIMGIVEAFGVGTYLFWLTKYVVRGAFVLTFVDNTGDYMNWIVDPIRNTATGLMTQLAGVGFDQAPAAVFDKLMVSFSAALVAANKSMPWSSWLGSLESIPYAFTVDLCWIIAFFAVGLAFGLFVVTWITLSFLLAIGPIFVLFAMAGPLRGWLMGWVNSLASQMLAMWMMGIALNLMRTASEQQLAHIVDFAVNGNFFSRLGMVIGGTVTLCLGALFCVTARGLANGLVGGAYAAAQPLASGFSSMISTGQSMISHSGGGHVSAGGSNGMATPSMAIPASAPGMPGAPSGNLAGNIRP